jgi:hypothetical protein
MVEWIAARVGYQACRRYLSEERIYPEWWGRARGSRLRFGRGFFDEKSYSGHRDCADDRTRQGLDNRDIRNPWLIQAATGRDDRERDGLEKVTAQGAGYQADDAVSEPAKAMLMESRRREMSAD